MPIIITAASPDSASARAGWRARGNTREIDQADYFSKHSHRMYRLCRLVATVDFPDELHLPADEPIVFAANHRSFLDIAVALAIFGKFDLTCRMQVRADMFSKPVIGPWLQRLGCIPTATAVRAEAEATALETLAAGSAVALMPEGRLVPPKDRSTGVGQGRTGVSRIVKGSGAMMIPVAIHGSDRIWPRGRPFPKLGLFRRRRLTVRLGEPMTFPHEDHQRNADLLMDTIAGMLGEIDEQQTR